MTPSSTRRTWTACAEFAKCMREHGIDLPDPDANGGAPALEKGDGPGRVNPDDQGFKDADKACHDKLPANAVRGGADGPAGR